MVGEQTALDIVDAYLSASFEGGRHQTRAEKLASLETFRITRGIENTCKRPFQGML